MRPKNVQEAALLTSVFRPGAMDASANDPRDPNRTMADVFIDRWTGKEKAKYTHPDLEPILKSSNAVIVFQEQLMQIANQIGGLSMNDTNKLRRAISKKTGDELIRLLNQVKEGMLSRGWTEDQATETIEQMKASGRYGFNKSHALSYVYIARACAYLKYHYPAQWWAAVLTNASKEDLVGYWNSISKHVLPPDINSSSDQYQVKNADKINWQVVPPLNVIEGVGPAALGEILEKQPFSSVTDFMDRIDRRIVNKRVMLRLIFSGVLDRFFAPGADFLDKAQEYLNLKAKLEGKKTPEAIPEEYRDMTPLRRELMKKLVYKTYSTDFLRV